MGIQAPAEEFIIEANAKSAGMNGCGLGKGCKVATINQLGWIDVPFILRSGGICQGYKWGSGMAGSSANTGHRILALGQRRLGPFFFKAVAACQTVNGKVLMGQIQSQRQSFFQLDSLLAGLNQDWASQEIGFLKEAVSQGNGHICQLIIKVHFQGLNLIFIPKTGRQTCQLFFPLEDSMPLIAQI